MLNGMAVLARKLGFQSNQISQLIKKHPDRLMARGVLLNARKPHRYQYNSNEFESLINQIVQCFSTAEPCEAESSQEMMADTDKPKARCGMPSIKAQRQDSPFLFFDHLYNDAVQVTERISTLFVRRCVYIAFFGKPSSDGLNEFNEGNWPSHVPTSPLFVEDEGAMPADEENQDQRR
jgi:hypothetical protein